MQRGLSGQKQDKMCPDAWSVAKTPALWHAGAQDEAVPHPSPTPPVFHLAAADPTAARGQGPGCDAVPLCEGHPQAV